MGGKPYLQIEVDEHFSKVGVITRVEAFLNSLSHRPVQPLPANFQIEDVPIRRVSMPARAETDKPLYLPNLGEYTPLLARYFVQNGVDAHILPALDEHAVGLGRAQTSAKEYLPFAALLGGVLTERETDGAPRTVPDSAIRGRGGRRTVRPRHSRRAGQSGTRRCENHRADARTPV